MPVQCFNERMLAWRINHDCPESPGLFVPKDLDPNSTVRGDNAVDFVLVRVNRPNIRRLLGEPVKVVVEVFVALTDIASVAKEPLIIVLVLEQQVGSVRVMKQGVTEPPRRTSKVIGYGVAREKVNGIALASLAGFTLTDVVEKVAEPAEHIGIVGKPIDAAFFADLFGVILEQGEPALGLEHTDSGVSSPAGSLFRRIERVADLQQFDPLLVQP